MKLAIVQMDVTLGEVERNLERVGRHLRTAAGQGAELIVFPECALSGYGFDSLDEARPSSQPIPGPATEQLDQWCRELGVHAVCGLLEAAGEAVYNSVVLLGPEGVLATYRKLHLPYMGVDRFTTAGTDPFVLYDVAGIRLGLNICYDGGFPEQSRCLTLMGADLIVLPTNWPRGSEVFAEHLCNVRALENTIYYASSSRIGTERNLTFVGGSRICDPTGKTLAVATATEETILYADIDPQRARQKHLVRIAGFNEVNRIADRRPELYQCLIEPHQLTRPGGR